MVWDEEAEVSGTTFLDWSLTLGLGFGGKGQGLGFGLGGSGVEAPFVLFRVLDFGF